VRYFLLREVPFGNDGDFSHRAMVHRLNGDLANDLGNLCQRVLTMIARNCDGRVPAPSELTAEDEPLIDGAARLLDAVREDMEAQAFHNALTRIWEIVGTANRYVDAQAPWQLRKDDPSRMATVLYVLAEAIRRVALIVQPFMPDSTARILDQLAVPAGKRSFDAMEARLTPGTTLPKPAPVFPRYVEEEEERAEG
jgi:methionyl-tRNA synthetase